MLVYYILISLFIAWVWVDYFRLIDIYDRNALRNFIFAFVLGGLSVPLTFLLNGLLVQPLGLRLTGHFFDDLIYSLYGIGLIEELAKTLAFLLFIAIFRKVITEPLDWLAYACTAALGFAAIENVLYFNNHGSEIITGRAIMSTLMHMMCSATMAYGYLLFRYRDNKSGAVTLFQFFFLAVLFHALYDLFLFQGLAILAMMLFLIFLNAFADMLNNGINQSPKYSHRHVVNSAKVTGHLLVSYGLIYLIQFVARFQFDGMQAAVADVRRFPVSALLMVIFSIRLSRFRIVPERWNPLRLELPFGIVHSPPFEGQGRSYFSIKGEAYNAAVINAFLGQEAIIRPVSKRHWIFRDNSVRVLITNKHFLDYDETFYSLRLTEPWESGQKEGRYLIKPKLRGENKINDTYPIAALLRIPEETTDLDKLRYKDLKFLHWIYLKPVENESP